MIYLHLYSGNISEKTYRLLEIHLNRNLSICEDKLSVKIQNWRENLITAVFLKNVVFILMGIILLLFPRYTHAQEFDIRGQVSAWAVSNPDKATQFGIRYIPDLMIETYLGDSILDTEISFNMYGGVQFQHNQESVITYNDFSPYRIWLRYSAAQFELRAGLQKINFGSAMLLRALMWFDSIDPRDPLQLTDGVYGVLGRYYFINNANIWIWVLYGNDRNRGWEIFVSDKKSPEFGGRLQVPLFIGEMAVTYHHRQLDMSQSPFGALFSTKSVIPENRIGLDGKWDLEVGIWAEAVLIYRNLEFESFNYQRQTNFGMDYTFDLGNGLHAIAEHFTLRFTEKAFNSGEGVSMSALSLNYPVGLLDDLTAMVYYEWDKKGWYRFLSWQRTYDNWSFYLMGFWNPDQYQLFQVNTQNYIYAGKGIQLLVVFNH
jgi:hypothetical protein